MTDSAQAATSLLTEHLRYTPLSLIDDIINSVNNLIYQGISSLENGLLSTPPEQLGFSQTSNSIPDTDGEGNVLYPEAKLEIENGLHQLETLLESTVDKNFDKFEIYVLRNILTVPEDLADWIRLGHYENLSFTQDPSAPTPESINLQRRKLQETQKLQRALQQETARNDAIIAQLRSMLSSPSSTAPKCEDGESKTTQTPNFTFLTTDPSAKALNIGALNTPQAPLTTNTTFTLSQLPALRAMLASLRPRMAFLSSTSNNNDRDSKTDERREYIESRTRMHLERTGELEAGQGGELVTGRSVDRDEVEALESIVGRFGGDEKKR